jgi:hypothetical protein
LSAAWIAVIASLGGVALGGLLNVLADTLRWRREDRQTAVARASDREERTQQLHVDLVTVGDELMSRLYNFVDFQDENPNGWRTDPFVNDQIDKLEAAWSSFNRTYNALRVSGMTPSMQTGAIERIRAAADDLYDVISTAWTNAYPPDPEAPPDAYGELANRFLDVVAAEIRPVRPRGQVTQQSSRARRQMVPPALPRTPPARPRTPPARRRSNS